MTREPPDLIMDLIELGGAGLEIIELDGGAGRTPICVGAVRLGVHRSGPIPCIALDDFDILLSCDCEAPRPWVGVAPDSMSAVIDALRARIEAQPAAATAAAQVFRITLDLAFESALNLESLAYSMLLASKGFKVWRSGTPVRIRGDDTPRVLITQSNDSIHIRLNRPAARNAFDARMRDDLVEALSYAREHPDHPNVVLSGEGPAFSAGGDLDTFGQASDVGEAHLIRILRSPVQRVRDLGDRLTVQVHGACVGAGIEIPAAANRVTARPGAVFRLPEIAMGLIPGAGGTATISRRIGRHRACFMAISGDTVDLAKAMAWGLVDAVET